VVRLLLSVLLLALALPANAVVCKQYSPRYLSFMDAAPWFEHYEDAGEWARSYFASSGGNCTISGQTAANVATLVAVSATGWTVNLKCPLAGAGPGNNYTGSFATRTGDYCTVNCPQGTREDKAVRMGWAREVARADGALWQTEDGRTYHAPLPGQGDLMAAEPPGVMCDGQCEWVADAAKGDWWSDAAPNGKGNVGMYRQMTYLRTGGTCSQRTPQVDATDTGPACNGALGTVNGHTFCAQKQAPSGAPAPGVSPKQSTSGAGAAPAGNGSFNGPNGEMPGKAGDVPGMLDVSGTGKGITASPSSSTTTSSNGTTSTTTLDLQVCGLPGKPACRIDESGTPTGQGFGDKEKGQTDSDWDKLDGMLPSITSTSGKNTSWAMPSWISAADCKPWNLGHLPVINVDIVVNVCAIKPYADGVLNFLWVFGTFLACLAMVQSVTMGPSKVGA